MTAAVDFADLEDDDSFGDDLPNGTELLRGQYTIETYLNSGGFGITYLARDSLDRVVVIKECFPSSMCYRAEKTVRPRSRSHKGEFEAIVKLFGHEARALAKLSHPNIVGVHQVFEDNDTAYMALDFVEGRDLLDVLESEPERLEPRLIRDILKRVLNAVSYIHDRGVLHRDISPDNILLDCNDNPVLIDFGAAREQATRASQVLSALQTVKDGYSPHEFYIADGEHKACSDLYALAATFYHLISGDAPPSSQQRLSAIAEKREDPFKPLLDYKTAFDGHFCGAINKALSLFPDDRIQSAEEWLIEIDAPRRQRLALQRARHDKRIEKAIQDMVAENRRVVEAEEEHARQAQAAHEAELAQAATAVVSSASPEPLTHDVPEIPTGDEADACPEPKMRFLQKLFGRSRDSGPTDPTP